MPTFEECLEPVLPTAHRIALNLTRNMEDAEDLVQEAAILAFRAFASFEPGTNFKAWFLRIQHNAFLNQLRRAGRRPQTVDLADDDAVDNLYLYEQTKNAGWHQSSSGDPAAAFLSRIETDEIKTALQMLPDEFRAVAVLYFLEEMSYEQIAKIVDVPLNTVRSRLHRARKLLQKSLWELAQERGLTPSGAPQPTKLKPLTKGTAMWALFFLAGELFSRFRH